MTILLFLNELSCATTPCRGDDVRASMTGFVNVLRAVRRRRNDVALVTAVPLSGMELAPDWPFARWAADNRAVDQRRLIMAFQNRAPFSDVGSIDENGVVDYFHKERPAVGLGFAHAFDSLGLSLSLTSGWDDPLVELERQMLVEDGDEGIVVISSVQVRHASAVGHMDAHEGWLAGAGLAEVVTGRQLWAAREDFFPHLVFHPRVEGHLVKLGPVQASAVRERLRGLEDATARWDPSRAATPEWSSLVTPEYEQRERLSRFEDLDGVTRVFEWHARFTPGEGRIHFRLDPAECRLVVAYIGTKLGI